MRVSKFIFPRPIALITTVNEEGKPNVASFSFLMPISFKPIYLAFAVAPTRYTFENLVKTKEFVFNIATVDMKEEVIICGTRSGRKVDKFKLAKLETEESIKVKPPRLVKSPAQLECVVVDIREYGDHYIVVGKAVEEHLKREDFKPLMHVTGSIYASHVEI